MMAIHATEHRETVEAEYYCNHCDHSEAAWVDSKGTGRGVTRGHAVAASVEAAGEEAADTLMYIPCPRCGETDDYGARFKAGVALTAILLLVGSMALMIGISVAQGIEFHSGTLIAIAVASAFVAFMYYFSRRRVWASAQKRVHFVRGATPDETRSSEM